MKALFDTIQDWPVIVQGALGSALFALVLFLGQKLFELLPVAVSKLSAGRRRNYLQNRKLRFLARASKDPLQKAYFPSMLWYRASRDLIKALIWLTLGLLFTNFIGVWGVIGYLGCLYHLFFALEVVKPITEDIPEIEKKLEETQKLIVQLETVKNAQQITNKDMSRSSRDISGC